MSLFRTLDRTSAVFNAAPYLTFLYPTLPQKSAKRSFSKSVVKSAPRLAKSLDDAESILIDALVRAGSCREHARLNSSLHRAGKHAISRDKTRRQSTWRRPNQKIFTPDIEHKQSGPLRGVRQFAKKELEALVDYYGIELDTRPEEDVQDTGSLVWNVGDTHEPWPLRDKGDAVHIRRLEKLLNDDEVSHDDLFDTYKELPSPGVVFLRTEMIRGLLHQLSIVERPSPLAMQRFLAILDDMKNAHIHITRTEWTSAIYLTGRAMGQVTEGDLQSAMYIWRDMERRAGVKGGYVTLNVLFDLAIRAGKYTIAESFFKELQARKLTPHRHFRVSLIYYYGILGNGEGVRKTYQELVNAGDIVDTVVMNAVIAALIRAGEPSAAEQVFERMKRLHASKSAPAPGHKFFSRTWRNRRLLGLHLTHEARRLNNSKDTEGLKNLQDYAPIAPDARTYALLIRHQAKTAGNIDRVYDLLKEMRSNSIPLEGTIFIAIFHGFHNFGGMRYSSWTRDKLEKTWMQFLKALQDSLERTWISVMAVISALKAFAKCTDPERTVRAWEEIRRIWEPSEDELESVLKFLRKIVPQRGGEGFF
ncbi:hypothetical protein EK21DRAFT_54523 [Setomelanomma holmii]|uniref:Pentatricopeptide repeat-containing protein n=1 Tax=Setomelanomma holmii TaxID=210430 RepID=A0A9P4LUD0_9PLEO|nr:hypothetical protein EK21DRAFT_54523 [Setomelanomma holmii]